MKQTNRKNKTKQSVNWPTSTYFTITDLVDLNPNMLTSAKTGNDITLRVRLIKAVEDGKIAELGSLTGGKGRPQKVYTHTPITQLAINKAKADKINLVDSVEKMSNRPTTAVNLSSATVNPLATNTTAVK